MLDGIHLEKHFLLEEVVEVNQMLAWCIMRRITTTTTTNDSIVIQSALMNAKRTLIWNDDGTIQNKVITTQNNQDINVNNQSMRLKKRNTNDNQNNDINTNN